MDYKIYQPKEINFFVDEKKVYYQKENYNFIWQGYMEVEDFTNAKADFKVLEKVFMKLNGQHPEGYKGHSLSTGDIVLLHDEFGERLYICTNFGWNRIMWENC